MSLINTRNIKKAKDLLDKNRHKVGDIVGKAAVQVDKASGGKTSDVTTKIEQAARKYSAAAIGPDGKPVGDKPLISAPVDTELDAAIDVDSIDVKPSGDESSGADAPDVESPGQRDA